MEIIQRKLSEVADVIAGQSPPSSTYNDREIGLPFYQGKTDFGNMFPVPRSWCSKPTKVAKHDDILMSVRAPVGPVNINRGDSCIGRGISAIRAKAIIDFKYLFYYLKSNQQLIEKFQTGSTFKAITQENLRKLTVFYPKSLIDQKRIAKVLSDCEQLIAWRKESIRLLDDYLEATFFEMFGDPVKNEKSWEVKPMEKVILGITSGTSYGGEEKKELSDEEYGVLKISAVTKGFFDAKEFKAVNKKLITKKIITAERGMFLLSRANTKELIAACCIVDKDYPNLFIPDKLWNLEINRENAEPQYLNFLFKNSSYRKLIAKKASGGHDSMLNISMKKFRSLTLPVPPIDQQRKFTSVGLKVEGLKLKVQTSLSELENLYASLSQKAFNGELDLSKVTLPEEPEIMQKTAVANEKTASEIISHEARREDETEFEFSNFDISYLKEQFDNLPFTFSELQDKIRNPGFPADSEHDSEKWRALLFKYLETNKPLIEQTFENETGTIKLQLTDEALKAQN